MSTAVVVHLTDADGAVRTASKTIPTNRPPYLTGWVWEDPTTKAVTDVVPPVTPGGTIRTKFVATDPDNRGPVKVSVTVPAGGSVAGPDADGWYTITTLP